MAIIAPIRNDGGMNSGRHNRMPMKSCEWDFRNTLEIEESIGHGLV